MHSDTGDENISKGIAVTVDLRGGNGAAGTGGIIGYRAKRHTDLIDIAKVNHYDPRDYWDPIPAEKDSGLTLNPGDFYILVSREAITVPPDHAAEMVAYDTLYGEFRVHYAGFFDPGSGSPRAAAPAPAPCSRSGPTRCPSCSNTARSSAA